jgi:hypothetical protein
MPRLACALVLLLLVTATAPAASQRRQKPPPPLPSIAPLNLPRLLDLYDAGRFDEAVGTIAQAGDETGRHLRLHWPVEGREWIDADPARRPQRSLSAAALALETEQLRAERGDWRVSGDDPFCAAACVLDWAQMQLVQRGAPDAAERAWYLAAASLARGVSELRYVYIIKK